MKGVLMLAALVPFALMLGTCASGDRPFSLGMTAKQIELVNSQLDLLHEEVAASQSSSGFTLLALVVSVVVPLLLGVILLVRAEKTALHNDEIIRQVARHGLTSKLIETEKLLDKPQSQARPRVLRLVRQSRSLANEKSESDDADDSDAG